MLGLPSLHTGHWDPIMRGVRRDRHGGQPAHRLVGHVAVDRPTTRRPTSSACCSSATPCSPRSTGCTRGSRCGSPTQDLPVGGRHRLGRRRCSTGSTTCCSYHDDVRHLAAASSLTPAEVLQRNFWFCAVEDPSSFALRDRHRRRPHPARGRLPALRLDLAAHPARDRRARSAACPPDDIRKITWENASQLYRHPVPAAVQADPDAF